MAAEVVFERSESEDPWRFEGRLYASATPGKLDSKISPFSAGHLLARLMDKNRAEKFLDVEAMVGEVTGVTQDA